MEVELFDGRLGLKVGEARCPHLGCAIELDGRAYVVDGLGDSPLPLNKRELVEEKDGPPVAGEHVGRRGLAVDGAVHRLVDEMPLAGVIIVAGDPEGHVVEHVHGFGEQGLGVAGHSTKLFFAARPARREVSRETETPDVAQDMDVRPALVRGSSWSACREEPAQERARGCNQLTQGGLLEVEEDERVFPLAGGGRGSRPSRMC